MNHNRSERYIDVLKVIISSYNETYYRSIGIAPNAVNKENEAQVWSQLYGGGVLIPRTEFKFKVDDYVRIAEHHEIFAKGREGGWTEEIFKISERISREPPVYKIIDLNDETVIGTFYEQELQKVNFTNDVFIVEEILKTRRRNGKLQYFVKWLGYKNSENSWIDELL